MTNHDDSSQTGGRQLRAADDLGRDPDREKQAAAMILTSPGKPFVYQGEELGYWGNPNDGSDEYLRAPIVWDAAASQCARKGVGDKVDNNMLKGSISVETQTADASSLLNVYKAWSRLRNTYPALADGKMTVSSLNGGSVASWYMTASDGQKMLVVHNCGAAEKTLPVSDDISRPVAVLGTVKADHDAALILSGHSSVVFLL